MITTSHRPTLATSTGRQHSSLSSWLPVPQIPHAAAALAAAADGRLVVLRIAKNDWMDAVGLVAYEDRTGVRSCVVGSQWAVIFRAQSICKRGETKTGVSFWVTPVRRRMPLGIPVVATFSQTVVTRKPLASRHADGHTGT